jgi:hypothetical protein
MEEKIEECLKKLLDIFEDIPFGNSDYQIIHTCINKEKYPHRAMRAVGLYLVDKIQTLYEVILNNREKEIKLKQLQMKYDNTEDELEKELIEIEIKRIKFKDIINLKLIKDAIHEINLLLPIISKIGKISREEFEQREANYFKERFLNLANKIDDAILSLECEQNNLYEKIKNLPDIIKDIKAITEENNV